MQSHGKAMVVGAFIGDSLALGAHWIYNTNKIESEIGEVNTPLPPLKNSYHANKQVGDFTHYGDQSLPLLQFLATNKGTFDPEFYSMAWFEEFSSYGGYTDK